MHMRAFGILFSIALVTLFSCTISFASTRARFRAESLLNDRAARLSAGNIHTCQVNDDGTVRCWGHNGAGQLGDGTTTTRLTPVAVTGLANAIGVASGGGHSCALLANGTVRCWGGNFLGQLGDGTTISKLTPVAVTGLSNAVAIAAGSSHTCALLGDGSVRCWGLNNKQQTAVSGNSNQLTPAQVASNAVSVTAGSEHTCALLANGTIRCWGSNDSGQLGSSSLQNVTAITAGSFHTCALLADGTGRCWGDNNYGTLGDGTRTDSSTPVAVAGLGNIVALDAGGRHSCALLANGTAQCWGNLSYSLATGGIQVIPFPTAVVGLTDAEAISAGGAHNCAIQANGVVRCWGSNGSGQLGNGTTSTSLTASVVAGGGGSVTAREIAAGGSHTCAVRANSTVSCWGSNALGQLGQNTIGGNQLSPLAVPGLSNVVAIAAGDAHTCALLADGTARCWGDNTSGQVDGGSSATIQPSPVPVTGLSNAIAIAAGKFHTCALLATGVPRCWGGTSGTPAFGLAPINLVGITAGDLHNCALRADGTALCWGDNTSNQLGFTGASFSGPALVTGLVNAAAIAGGASHSCALLVDGTGRCWGSNLLGQLGNGTTAPQPVPGVVVSFNNAVAIAAGFGHTCAVLATGGARCWGDNAAGQLGDGTNTQRLTPAVVQTLKQVQVRTGGTTFAFVPLSNTVQITTGRRHSCALIANGAVSCWGENTFGQLGNNSTTNSNMPISVPSFTLNIDPAVTLEPNGRVTTVTVVATCEAGQWLHAEVTLTQGTVSGRGIATGQCAGGLTRYPVRVPA